MTRFLVFALMAASLLCAQQRPAETPAAAPPAVVPPAVVPPAAVAPPADAGPEAIVQKLFDSMAARDALAAKDLFVPDADLVSLGAKGQANRMPLLDFLKVLGSGKAEWKERIWNATVLVHGPIAVVWAPYDFHLKGDFTHCGYDSISLLKTAAGWKITYISDTRETDGCVNPLGPPTH